MDKPSQMSLKAKLEAVIYAAEEPVTLAQLVSLFAEEALALRAEQSAETDSSAASSEPAEESQENLSLPAAELPEEPVESAVDAEAEAKRQTRQRDREIREILRSELGELVVDYATGDRGIEIREIAGGYRMATKPEYHDAVRGFVKSLKPPMKLSLQALETLAVIAYKQPVTAPEISEIRGVDSSGVLGSLLSRKLITTSGRKQVIGRPILYKTTKEFLVRFGLKDVSELPSMEEFEKMAGELEETDELIEQSNEPELPLEGNTVPDAEDHLPADAVEQEEDSASPASTYPATEEPTVPD
jgi:segregation and condensation protein B